MSNQVYSSPQQKYYTRGLNFYGANVIQTVSSTTQQKILWTATATIQLPSALSLAGTGIFSVLEEGMYSISATVGVSPASNSIDPYCRLAIFGNGLGYTTTLTQAELRFPNLGSGTSISPQIPVGWCGYLNAGATFSITIDNLDTTNLLDTIPGETQMVISKIL